MIFGSFAFGGTGRPRSLRSSTCSFIPHLALYTQSSMEWPIPVNPSRSGEKNPKKSASFVASMIKECRLENMVTSASGHFLCSVIVHPNQRSPSGLPIISDGPFFFDQAESVSFEQSHQFAKFQNRLLQSTPSRSSPHRTLKSAARVSRRLKRGLPLLRNIQLHLDRFLDLAHIVY